VMVGWDCHAKLLDFGLAKSALNEAITRPGMAKGKFAYLAPELWSEAKPDARADIFSLGVCLFEALTGVRLYHRNAPLDSKRAIVDEPVPSLRQYLPNVPEALDRIVKRSMAKRPEDRFESAGAFQTALVELVEALGARQDNEPVASLVGEVFADERWRGPKLEPTTFGQSASMRPPPPVVDESASTGPNPALAAPSIVPPARQGAMRFVIAGGAALAAFLGISVIVGMQDYEPQAHVDVVEPPRFAAAAAQLAEPAPAPVEIAAPAPNVPAAPEPRVVEMDEVVFRTAPVQQGLVSINTRPWSEVLVDGRSVGMTPIAELRVSVGRHELTFVDPDGNRHRGSVVVSAEGIAHVFQQLPYQEPAAPPAPIEEAPAVETAEAAEPLPL
jgi:hypothetical protein